MKGDRCNRISPWEINPSSLVGSVSGYGRVMLSGCKRSRFAVQHPTNINDIPHHEYPSSSSTQSQ